MVCLVVKRDVNYKSHCAKSRIVVLVNHENCAFNKSQLFAPVLSYSYLWLLTSKVIEKSCILHQGNFKSSFCNAYSQKTISPSSSHLSVILNPVLTNSVS